MSPARDKPSAAAPVAGVTLLDRVLFYILLAVLCARPLIGESFERLETGLLAELDEAGGPTPATTAWLDTLLLAASVLVLGRKGRWRRNLPVGIGLALLAAAVLVSSIAAGDKHAALLAGSSLLIGVLAGVALCSLLRARWMLQLLIAGLLAGGCPTAVKCIRQYTVEFSQMKEYWEQTRKPRLIERGYDPDAPFMINYERRMLAREAHGYLPHANLTGSGLMMWLLVAGGLLAASLVRSTAAPVPKKKDKQLGQIEIPVKYLALIVVALFCALLVIALWFTGSLGALAAGITGLAALEFLGFSARWSGRHARALFAGMLAGYVAVVTAVAAYGFARGTLPHPSLAFRWYYWTTAGQAWQDAPLTGLGRENFAAAYMMYKPPQSTEEVANPHNLWLSLLVELGPLGLAGSVLLGALAVLAGLRNLNVPFQDIAPGSSRSSVIVARAVPVAIGVLLVHVLFSGTPFAAPGVAVVWGVDVALLWVLGFGASLCVLHWLDGPSRRASWLIAGLCAAVLAAFAHSLLSFALLTPAGLAVFVLCAVGAAGVRSGVDARRSEPIAVRFRTRVILLAAGFIPSAAHLLWVSVPTGQTTVALRHLDAELQRPPQQVDHNAVRAAAYEVIHTGENAPSSARVAARALLQIAQWPDSPEDRRLRDLRQAVDYAELALRRNSRDSNSYSLLATIEQELARTHDRLGHSDDARRARQEAAASWDRAVELYPTDPRRRISAGQAWYELWQRTGVPDAARRAREHFRKALAIDDCRPPHEVVRLRSKERKPVEDCLGRLQPATAPAPR
ncbi:MAG: O-antigen ligase family protein [Phycisphaerae bacterium]|nr:O-antigen ligase family protein [Phycisphaerae bacterium]